MTVRFGGNDYLDLSRHPVVIEAAREAVRTHGASSGGSRVSIGTTEHHLRLEEELAEFLGTGEVVLLSSGYLAALAAFDAVAWSPSCSRRVVIDAAAHVALGAGAGAAGAERLTFDHADPRALQKRLASLAESRGGDGRATGSGSNPGETVVVVADGVEGFCGECLPLDALVGVARRHGVPSIVDDAHGVGLLGSGGRGSLEACGVDLDAADLILVGSLGKALGSTGGFVAACGERAARLRGGAAYTGSTALAPASAAAARAALRILREDAGPRRRVLGLALRLREGLRTVGAPLAAPVSRPGRTPAVVTVEFPSAREAAAAVEALGRRGIEVAHFTYVSSSSASRLRFPLASRHTERDVDSVVDVLSELSWLP